MKLLGVRLPARRRNLAAGTGVWGRATTSEIIIELYLCTNIFYWGYFVQVILSRDIPS